jgi:lysophospholipase L1-like esterase
MPKHSHSLLCLGDSYTIGEGVPLYESFPYQAVQQLRSKNYHFHAPEVLAKTGWTTFELAEKVLHTAFNPPYDFVTLLIGVNNQYRNLPIDEYGSDMEFLIRKAIHFAGEKSSNVIVLSIPDWGRSPFALEKEPAKIAKAIDAFNTCNRQLAQKMTTSYLDITSGDRSVEPAVERYTDDGLHPSAIEYSRWATLLADSISRLVKH